MPCGCFGGGVGKDGDKYGPKGALITDTKPPPQPITTKPPVQEKPIPAPESTALLASEAAPPPSKGGGSSPTADATRREDDPDKANRRRDVVASYYSDECELLAYKTTASRPTSQVNEDGEASPPVATSSPTPSSPSSIRSAASTRADLAEKRREFFKPLINEEPWTGTGSRQAHHAQPLLEAHEREMENYKEPTVKDVVHKFEHLPEQISTSKLETEVRLGRNSSTTVTVLHNTDKQQTQKPPRNISHQDNPDLTPEQQKQEQQLVNKAAVHQQLLAGGQLNLRSTPKSREMHYDLPPLTVTAPDQPHDDDCIIQTPAVTVDTSASTPAKPPPKPAHLPPENAQPPIQSQPVVSEPTSIVSKPEYILSDIEPTVIEYEPVVTEPQSVVTEPHPVMTESHPVVTEPEPFVAEPEPFIAEHKPFVTETKPFATETEPEDATEHALKNVTQLEHEHKSSVIKTEPEFESLHDLGPESDVTHSKLFTESKSEICQNQGSKAIETKVQTAVNEPMFTDKEDGTSHTETTKTTVMDDDGNKMTHTETITTKIISSSEPMSEISSVQTLMTEPFSERTIVSETSSFVTDQSPKPKVQAAVNEPMFTDKEDGTSHTETTKTTVMDDDGNKRTHTETITTKIISSSEPMSEISSVQTLMTEPFSERTIVSETSSFVTDQSPVQVCYNLNETTNNEEQIKSVFSKAEPSTQFAVETMPKELIEDISHSEHSFDVSTNDGTLQKDTTKTIVNVSATDDGTTHTETTKTTIMDDDSNMMTHTETTTTTKIISSSGPISEISSAQTLMTEPFSERTIVRETSSFVMDQSPESSSLIEGPTTHNVTKTNSELILDEQQKQNDLHSNLSSSVPPISQIGSSPSPSSSPSPRNSSHSSPASPCASSPSPPASPDSSRAHKLGMAEHQHDEQQVKQEIKDSYPALSLDQPSPDENTSHKTTLNNQDATKVQHLNDDILDSGTPALPMDSRNSHTCNEADVTAPASLEDDGLGSEIDDNLDSMDCFSEDGHSQQQQQQQQQHHHQSVPAPPPPSSAS